MINPPFPELSNVAERIRAVPHLLLGLDYDGTLTPIVDEPARAILPATMRQAIWALARRDDTTISVISGRAHADLQEFVAIPEVIYAGNHGMEISGPGLSFIEPHAKEAAPGLHLVGQEIGRKLHHIQGAFVEDKGLTLSVHYRRVAAVDVEFVTQVVRDAVTPVNDRFHVTLGDKVLEIRPLSEWNKGAAITWINQQLGKGALVIYIGDDATDEDAFRALPSDGITIRVGDPMIETAARYRLPDPGTVLQFLQWVETLREERRK